MAGQKSFWLPACHARGRQAKLKLENRSEISLPAFGMASG